jgi:hypothetical protein
MAREHDIERCFVAVTKQLDQALVAGEREKTAGAARSAGRLTGGGG